MNDSDWKPKKLPPDDFSKTAPNIRIPREDLPPPREDFSNDWEKTNYNYSPKQSPPADDWGRPSSNNPPRQSNYDWGKTIAPGQKSNDDWGKTVSPGRQPRDNDWGVTQANINIPNNFEQDDFGGGRRQENNHTMPYFQLPQAEREKYQNLPPTEAKETEAEEKKKKGGIPGWLWVSGGLGAGFLFLVAVLLLIWLFIPKTGFEVVITGSQPGSEAFVDGQKWGTSQPDGTILLQSLEAGSRKITVKKSGYEDYTDEVKGQNGDKIPFTPRQEPMAVTPVDDGCKGPFKPGEEAKAAACASGDLDKLGDDFTVQQLLDAMNKYIVKFDVNKFDLKDNDKQFLLKSAGYMKKLAAKYPNVKIEVGGHTDSDGSDAKNQTLSDNRAKSVHDFLVTSGVNAAMLTERGYGAKSPKVKNDSPEHKFQNRRIEYTALMTSN